MAHALRIHNCEPPAQIPPPQENPNADAARGSPLPRVQWETHSQDEGSTRSSSSPSRHPQQPLECEDNPPPCMHYYRQEEQEGKRQRSPSCEASFSPSMRGRRKEQDCHARRKAHKERRISLPSSPFSKVSSSSLSYSLDEYAPIRHQRKRHDTYHAWMRSRKLQKFKEGGKSISFQCYDGSYGATNKVLSFIQ